MANWPQMKDQVAAIIKTKTRDEWDAVFDGIDVCYAPVLAMSEARHHPHNKARETFIDDGEVWQPAPVPRFSRSKPGPLKQAAETGTHTSEVLAEFGFDSAEIDAMLAGGVVAGES